MCIRIYNTYIHNILYREIHIIHIYNVQVYVFYLVLDVSELTSYEVHFRGKKNPHKDWPAFGAVFRRLCFSGRLMNY